TLAALTVSGVAAHPRLRFEAIRHVGIAGPPGILRPFEIVLECRIRSRRLPAKRQQYADDESPESKMRAVHASKPNVFSGSMRWTPPRPPMRQKYNALQERCVCRKSALYQDLRIRSSSAVVFCHRRRVLSLIGAIRWKDISINGLRTRAVLAIFHRHNL